MTLDLLALSKLVDAVEVGWKVKIIDHDLGSESRDDCTVTARREHGWIITPRTPWASQGRKFTTTEATITGDIEVDGLTLTRFRTPPPHTGKPRVKARTYIFEPPR